MTDKLNPGDKGMTISSTAPSTDDNFIRTFAQELLGSTRPMQVIDHYEKQFDTYAEQLVERKCKEARIDTLLAILAQTKTGKAISKRRIMMTALKLKASLKASQKEER